MDAQTARSPTKSVAPPSTATGCEEFPEDPDALYKRGVGLIEPYMNLADRAAASHADRERHLRAGIACLDRVVALSPSNWAALWIRGKAFQSLGDHGNARSSFARAYQLESRNPDVGREYVLELLETGASSDAVEVAEKLSRDQPKDAGLLSNLALAQVLNQDLSGATRNVDAALQLDPTDAITKALKQRIDEIASGQRKQPRTLADLQER